MECILRRMDNLAMDPRREQANVISESSEVIHKGMTGRGGIVEDLMVESPEPAHHRVLAIQRNNMPTVSNETTNVVSVIELNLQFLTHQCICLTVLHFNRQ